MNKQIPQYNTPSLHAEIDALKSLQRSIESYDLVVLRFSHTKLMPSRPCYHCLKTLVNSNIKIKNVYYSDNGDDAIFINGGTIKKEKFVDMLHNSLTKMTSGSRKKLREMHQ